MVIDHEPVDVGRNKTDARLVWEGYQVGRFFVAGHHEVGVIPSRIADIALGKHPRARAADELRAGEFLLAIAGVRASDVASQEPFKEIMSAPVNVSVVIGAMPTSYPDVIDSEARLVTES